MSRINPKQNVRAPNDVNIDAPDPRLKRVRLLAKALDNSITIPGIGRKIGLDPIIGLIPGIGDVIGAAMSGYIILEAARAEASALTLARMVVNVGIDTALGAIPALGDLFDAAWKSNTKNVALLERHLAAGAPAAGTTKHGNIGMMALILVALVVILGAGLALSIYTARLLWNAGTR